MRWCKYGVKAVVWGGVSMGSIFCFGGLETTFLNLSSCGNGSEVLMKLMRL